MPRRIKKFSDSDFRLEQLWEFDNLTYYVTVRKDNHYFYNGRGEWVAEFELAYAFLTYTEAQICQSSHGKENCYVLEIRKM